MHRLPIAALSVACWAALAGGAVAQTRTPVQTLDALADRVAAQTLDHDPSIAYFTGLKGGADDRFEDRSPAAIAAYEARQRDTLKALLAIDPKGLPPASRATWAVIREDLESQLQMRVCRTELWNVNHFEGWQSGFAQVAEAQPVGSAKARADALKRWSTVPAFVDTEIANLRRGLAQGYSAPKSVVRRVIAQMDELAAAKAEDSPFYGPAKRDQDPAFKAAFAALIGETINPALARYRDFLRDEYLPKAREGVAMSDLPNGEACYRAWLRAFTTLDRSPQEVYELGQRTVEANRQKVLALGKTAYGLDDFDAIVARSKASPANHFKSSDELLAYSRAVLVTAKAASAGLVLKMPAQDVVIEPMRAFEDAAGVSSHYDVEPDVTRPGTYRIQLKGWETKTRAEAALTVVHEAWPGHHLQIALARETAPDTDIAKLTFNSAYIEGWARYAEAMAEDAGIYDNEDVKIMRRVWPARGMVVDPGLHAFHWSRQQAIDYLVATGRFTPQGADDMVDRMAVMPGQLTSYDSGGLEMMALRDKAKAALGDRFDLRAFNQVVLEGGSLPLGELRIRVEAWIASTVAAKRP